MVQLAGHHPIKQKVASLIPVRAHAWVTGSVPPWGMYERRPIDVSLAHRCFSPSLSPSLLPSLK